MSQSNDQSQNPSADKSETAARPDPPKARAKVKRQVVVKRMNAATGRSGTQKAKVLALLRRPAGASLQELRKATGWQPHSVRGFLSGTLKKKMGLPIDSIQRANGDSAYHVKAK